MSGTESFSVQFEAFALGLFEAIRKAERLCVGAAAETKNIVSLDMRIAAYHDFTRSAAVKTISCAVLVDGHYSVREYANCGQELFTNLAVAIVVAASSQKRAPEKASLGGRRWLAHDQWRQNSQGPNTAHLPLRR